MLGDEATAGDVIGGDQIGAQSGKCAIHQHKRDTTSLQAGDRFRTPRLAAEVDDQAVRGVGVGFANAALGAVFALVGLEVIGLGPANIIDLGLLINYAISWGAMSLGAWPIFVAPVVFLSFVFISVNLINIGLEEIYNPRLRGTAGA
jgi:hypothetical protein